MKHFLFVAAVVLSTSQLCSAVPACVAGTLTSYEALGSAGCMIGGNTFFNFQTVPGSFGATPIATTSVTIEPFGGTYNPGILGTTKLTASGDALEAIFTYRISGNSYTSDTITLANSSETGAGDITDVQNFCAGGTFGPDGISGCSGSPGSLLTLNGLQNQNSSVLGPANLLSVTDDFTLDGTFGSASGGSLTDQFTAVPEPFSLLLLGIGSVLILIKLRFNS